MEPGLGEFQRLVVAVLARFFAQRSRPWLPGQGERFARQLGELIAERGLPRALREDEVGAPGSMSEQECAPLVARVVAGLDEPMFVEAAKQLVKACFYPEFKVCRDSFREVTREGACRRQELERVRSRISGTHCVDCPHWVSLSPVEHARFLRQEWRGAATVFDAHRDVFLPEDFRDLRRWLRAAARAGAYRA
jgi:hypothetical protein